MPSVARLIARLPIPHSPRLEDIALPYRRPTLVYLAPRSSRHFDTLDQLARALHRGRGRHAIRLEDCKVERGPVFDAYPAVNVYQDDGFGGEQHLAIACIQGLGRHTLEAALRRTEPGRALEPERRQGRTVMVLGECFA